MDKCGGCMKRTLWMREVGDYPTVCKDDRGKIVTAYTPVDGCKFVEIPKVILPMKFLNKWDKPTQHYGRSNKTEETRGMI